MATKGKTKLIMDNQLKGNWGEQFIATELASQGCLVRHVAQGRDSGIDLYCEATWNGIPWLHFWCQVKTEKRWTGKRKIISKSFEDRDIDYWLKQPIPVFIFLVPDVRDRRIFPYYICTPLHLKQRRITSFLRIEKRNDLQMFLPHTVMEMAHEWDLMKGKVSPMPHPVKSNVLQFPPGTTGKYEEQISDSLCWTLWRLSSDILFPKDIMKARMMVHLTPEDIVRVKRAKPYIDALRILLETKGYEHHEGQHLSGLYYEFEDMFEKALQCFERALTIINSYSEENKTNHALARDKIEIERCLKRVQRNSNIQEKEARR